MGRPIRDLKVFEIGYGARPYRLIAMINLGIDSFGVDLDAPLLSFRIGDFLQIYRKNGGERLLKSLLRFLIGDIAETRQIRRMIEGSGGQFHIPRERFLVGDAAEVLAHVDGVDVFLSEDVFEHIPRKFLGLVVARMATILPPHGIAIIRPNVITGISGGHRVEWFQANIGKRWCAGWSEPWGHLRAPCLTGDTYLNKLTRADYRSLFEEHFTILHEQEKLPGLGSSYLTDAIAHELARFSRDELFSNQVLFVLGRKRPLTASEVF